ncbi:MAG TPA: aminoglycoside phosphotransferase family protein [Acidimicrobiales bacterium]|nr:aminoglycoside phosphotransferase family protein [Acidimicrobiales bacterium]
MHRDASAGGLPVIPSDLAARVRREGREGWLNELPHLIVELAERWGLQLGTPFSRGPSVSWVAPAGLVDGISAVLKVGMPHREASTEAAGLPFFAGQGAVQVLRADDEVFALVEERCDPGTDLWDLSVDEGNRVAAQLLGQLWHPPDGAEPIERLSDLANEWKGTISRRCDSYPSGVVELGVAFAQQLATSQEELVVLHGDFHPGNVLRSQRGWLSIDCKPLVGEPAFDLATLLANRLGIDPAWEPENPDQWPFAPSITARELARQIDYFTDTLGLKRDRVLGWAIVRPRLELGTGNDASVRAPAVINTVRDTEPAMWDTERASLCSG